MKSIKDSLTLNSERVLNDPKYDKFRNSNIIEFDEALDFKVVDEEVTVSEPESEDEVTIVAAEDTTLLLRNDYENMSKREFNEAYLLNQQEMSPIEKRFVEHYCDTLNGTESVVQVGYTVHRASASVQASRLLKKDYIKRAVDMRPLYLSYSQSIPDKKGIRFFLTQIIEDFSNTPMERMKAMDMLAKLDFHYEKEQVKQDNHVIVEMAFTEEVQRALDDEAQKMLETSTQPLEVANN